MSFVLIYVKKEGGRQYMKLSSLDVMNPRSVKLEDEIRYFESIEDKEPKGIGYFVEMNNSELVINTQLIKHERAHRIERSNKEFEEKVKESDRRKDVGAGSAPSNDKDKQVVQKEIAQINGESSVKEVINADKPDVIQQVTSDEESNDLLQDVNKENGSVEKEKDEEKNSDKENDEDKDSEKENDEDKDFDKENDQEQKDASNANVENENNQTDVSNDDDEDDETLQEVKYKMQLIGKDGRDGRKKYIMVPLFEDEPDGIYVRKSILDSANLAKSYVTCGPKLLEGIFNEKALFDKTIKGASKKDKSTGKKKKGGALYPYAMQRIEDYIIKRGRELQWTKKFDRNEYMNRMRTELCKLKRNIQECRQKIEEKEAKKRKIES